MNKFKTLLFSFCDRALLNTFQKRNVSSPAPVTIASPSGLNAKYSTRYEWPVNLATCVNDGYFHTRIWFCEYPCVDTNSDECFDHARLHTCEPVSTHCIGCPVSVFQNRMQRSAVPPPLANSPWWCGDHAIAFTAAICSEYDWTGLNECWFHTYRRLSLPPLARYWLSGDHLRPHTSCRWPLKRRSDTNAGVRVSRCIINRSRDPLDKISPFHASAPTRAECPCNLFIWNEKCKRLSKLEFYFRMEVKWKIVERLILLTFSTRLVRNFGSDANFFLCIQNTPKNKRSTNRHIYAQSTIHERIWRVSSACSGTEHCPYNICVKAFAQHRCAANGNIPRIGFHKQNSWFVSGKVARMRQQITTSCKYAFSIWSTPLEFWNFFNIHPDFLLNSRPLRNACLRFVPNAIACVIIMQSAHFYLSLVFTLAT